MNPLVSIICISYNHAAFIKEALNAVFSQTYEFIEVIVLDDGSQDDSQNVIREILSGKEVQFIAHKANVGYTRTFNEGLRLAKGKFIVDFALDDVMLPEFISSGIARFKQHDQSTGVLFSNADYINANSEVIGNHNEILFEKGMVSEIAEGNIFAKLISRYFICTPTMIIRKEVFDRLGGYDESLAYEDFDFWIRSSRHWDYAYVDGVYMQKRKLETSMSAARYRFLNNEQLSSTLRVCYKAFHLCKSQEEFQALRERLNYEYRQCLRNGALDLADECLVMLGRVGGHRDIPSFLVRYTGKNFFR